MREETKLYLLLLWMVVIIVIAIVSVIFTSIAMYNCGFTNALLYGKNIFWAWYFGYC